MNMQPLVYRQRPRSVHHRLVQAGVVACGLVAGLVELLALQRRRLVGRCRAGVRRP